MHKRELWFHQPPAEALVRRTAEQRIAHTLSELSTRRGDVIDGRICFDIPQTLGGIGHMARLTPIHVAVATRRLRDDGIIATSGQTVTILDIARLWALAEFAPGNVH